MASKISLSNRKTSFVNYDQPFFLRRGSFKSCDIFIALTSFLLGPGEKIGCSSQSPSKGQPWFCNLSEQPTFKSTIISFVFLKIIMLSFLKDVIKNLRLNYLFHVRRCFIFRNWPSAHSTATLHFRKAANRPEVIFDFMVLFRFAIVLRLCLMFLTEIKYIRFLACCLFVYRASKANIMEKYQ